MCVCIKREIEHQQYSGLLLKFRAFRNIFTELIEICMNTP